MVASAYVYSKRDRGADPRSAPFRGRDPLSGEPPPADQGADASPGLRASAGPYGGRGAGGPGGEHEGRAFTNVNRRVGARQKQVGVGFVVLSLGFLALSVEFKSAVLEIDSVASFVVAAILFLKESRNRVQSRVLGAVVGSPGTTIAQLSRAGSGRYIYVPRGESVSDVSVVRMSGAGSDQPPGDEPGVVPPGLGLGKLFAREAEGAQITLASLPYLLPPIMRENFGLAEGVGITSDGGRVEVTLRRPAVLCSCAQDESRSTGVVGCAVSSFLAVLYSFGSQKAVSLDRCQIDSESKDWKISMSILESQK